MRGLLIRAAHHREHGQPPSAHYPVRSGEGGGARVAGETPGKMIVVDYRREEVIGWR
ncbi:MAG: hypothetical protein AB1425_00270 [Actinomycetota bacterium]